MKRRFCAYAGLAAYLAVTAFLPAAHPSQQGAITVQRSLSELVAQAATIVRGRVSEVKVERHPQLRNLTTLVVTIRVERTLKGESVRHFTFRQYLWDARARDGKDGYVKGEELLLLVNPTSRYGLTSPAGMEQGRFRVLKSPTGQKTAVNGRGNQGLFAGEIEREAAKPRTLSATARNLLRDHRSGRVPLEQLEEIILEMSRKP